MKICFLLSTYNKFGGVERVVINLVNLLSEIGEQHYQITLLAYCDDGEKSPFMIDDTIKLKHIYNTPVPLHKGFWKAMRFLIKDIKSSEYNILIGCSSMFFPLAVSGRFFKNSCLVLWEHSHFFLNTEVRFQRYCRKFWAEFADAVVVLTNTDRMNYLNNIRNRNIYCINNMLDQRLDHISATYNQQSKGILSVGRLCAVKNFNVIIDIGMLVFSKHPDWYWDIWGDGPLRSSLQDAINKAGLQKNITLKGWNENIYDIYHNYSMFVSTSHDEGFGLAILEAMANQLPVVSFDVLCGPREIIEHNINGFLISNLDFQEMQQAIIALIENPEKRQQFSNAARKNINRFSKATILSQWINLFEKITAK